MVWQNVWGVRKIFGWNLDGLIIGLEPQINGVAHGLWFQNVALDNVSSFLKAALVCSYLHWHGSCCLKAVLVKVYMFCLKKESYSN